ncbi:MAG: hypothetical protein WDA42_00525 [Candidatus Bathyarchaeia archaeon]
MRHTKTVTVPEHTEEITEYITCDLCGAKKQYYGFTQETVNIRYDCFILGSFVVDAKHEKIVVDMCPTCFKTVFLAWLKEKYNFVPDCVSI